MLVHSTGEVSGASDKEMVAMYNLRNVAKTKLRSSIEEMRGMFVNMGGRIKGSNASI